MITFIVRLGSTMATAPLTGMISVDTKKGDRANLHRPLMTFIMSAFPDQQEVCLGDVSN